MSTQAAAAQGANTGSLAPDAKVTITKDTANGTEYVILEFLPASKPDHSASVVKDIYLPGWREHSRETARTDQAAIRQALEGNTDGGTFVAIPVRSFKPVKVTPETRTTYKLEEAK